jgi:hypothetical protein
MSTNGFRLYLRLGDVVAHRDHREWGEGRVIEEMTSTVPGGTCLVRVQFEDGRTRTFNNDLDAQTCGYYFGLRKHWDSERLFAGRAAAYSPRRRRLPPAGPARPLRQR